MGARIAGRCGAGRGRQEMHAVTLPPWPATRSTRSAMQPAVCTPSMLGSLQALHLIICPARTLPCPPAAPLPSALLPCPAPPRIERGDLHNPDHSPRLLAILQTGEMGGRVPL